MSIVIVSHVEKFHGSQGDIIQALNDTSFAVGRQEFTAVMGASGNGKTTLLDVISTVDAINAGNVEINGNNICELREDELTEFRKKELGLIFQDLSLLGTLTLQESIVLPSALLKKRAEQIDLQVNALVEALQIQDILGKYPHQVSGGQRQRYACTRATVHDPSLIPVDEPTDTLDSHSFYLLIEQFWRMNTEPQVTTPMVTRDAFSASYTKRVLFLKNGTVFNEIYRGSLTGKTFFQRILDVMQLLGGDVYAAR